MNVPVKTFKKFILFFILCKVRAPRTVAYHQTPEGGEK